MTERMVDEPDFAAAERKKSAADTAQNPSVIRFIQDAAKEALDYDLILASPSMGTGGLHPVSLTPA